MKRLKPDYDELIVERITRRTFRARRCWLSTCARPAAWHVTSDETDEVLWACEEHKTVAFS